LKLLKKMVEAPGIERSAGAHLFLQKKVSFNFSVLTDPTGSPALSRSIPVDAEDDRSSRDNGTTLALKAVAAALDDGNVVLARRLVAALLPNDN
jgi:hypothetical protein